MWSTSQSGRVGRWRSRGWARGESLLQHVPGCALWRPRWGDRAPCWFQRLQDANAFLLSRLYQGSCRSGCSVHRRRGAAPEGSSLWQTDLLNVDASGCRYATLCWLGRTLHAATRCCACCCSPRPLLVSSRSWAGQTQPARPCHASAA